MALPSPAQRWSPGRTNTVLTHLRARCFQAVACCWKYKAARRAHTAMHRPIQRMRLLEQQHTVLSVLQTRGSRVHECWSAEQRGSYLFTYEGPTLSTARDSAACQSCCPTLRSSLVGPHPMFTRAVWSVIWSAQRPWQMQQQCTGRGGCGHAIGLCSRPQSRR